jgi:molecular chaperone GrpE
LKTLGRGLTLLFLRRQLIARGFLIMTVEPQPLGAAHTVHGQSAPTEPAATTQPDGSEPSDSAARQALGATSVAEVERDLQAALARAAESQDMYLRARAEIENTRRRAQDDVSKAHKYAVETFAEALVPVMDSLEKALQSQPGSADALREGVQITLRQLRAAFERGRLVELDPVGQKFDPHRHQAIAMVPAPEGTLPNHVVTVLQKGWLITDRVLRPALVTVSQAGAGSANPNAAP